MVVRKSATAVSLSLHPKVSVVKYGCLAGGILVEEPAGAIRAAGELLGVMHDLDFRC